MSSTTIIPVIYSKKTHPHRQQQSNDTYSVVDHGNGKKTINYRFNLQDYRPEDISVELDDSTLRIKAIRPHGDSYHSEFVREFNLGTAVDTRLVRNVYDSDGYLNLEIVVSPRYIQQDYYSGGQTPIQYYQQQDGNLSSPSVLTFDLKGYRPENVLVRVNQQGLLKISATHVDNTYGNRINREYFRPYQLPSSMNYDLIRAKMNNDDRILRIELPATTTTSAYDYYGRPYGARRPYIGGPGALCFCNIL
ncbi:unnamed protein product [Didymodactylos carnosus]|uniref:SHSP domain-containing protein n=1 Tax=Didymodactylos carnosus TaxID=1234261 RepID=A0A813NFK7_9BILA|nr:unnamed protein product [Didymodactylos carnosus]CAF0737988.1 unnamed protein product [Didymodactylos carnosus]CAF3495542.1 unnamed protein product [Didymodactylos carnosus]CAF3516043.1 unnamed protein product [Didymodactylos carnosus]